MMTLLTFSLLFFLRLFLDQGDLLLLVLLLLLLLSLMVLKFVLFFFVRVLVGYLVSSSQVVFKVALASTTATRTWFLVSLFLSSNFSSESSAYSKRRFFINAGVEYSLLAMEFDGDKVIDV